MEIWAWSSRSSFQRRPSRRSLVRGYVVDVSRGIVNWEVLQSVCRNQDGRKFWRGFPAPCAVKLCQRNKKAGSENSVRAQVQSDVVCTLSFKSRASNGRRRGELVAEFDFSARNSSVSCLPNREARFDSIVSPHLHLSYTCFSLPLNGRV